MSCFGQLKVSEDIINIIDGSQLHTCLDFELSVHKKIRNGHFLVF